MIRTRPVAVNWPALPMADGRDGLGDRPVASHRGTSPLGKVADNGPRAGVEPTRPVMGTAPTPIRPA